MSLAPHMDFASYVHQYYNKGYLVYQEGGEAGKVCADHMNKTVPQEEVVKDIQKTVARHYEHRCLTGGQSA